jgi:hypothetical protein
MEKKMPNANKIKGSRIEREFVKRCERYGLSSKRSWGSDGRALGEEKEVDCMVEGYTVQCKCGYNQPSLKLKDFLTNVDFCLWSAADKRKHPEGEYVFMTVDTFIQLMVLLKMEVDDHE